MNAFASAARRFHQPAINASTVAKGATWMDARLQGIVGDRALMDAAARLERVADGKLRGAKAGRDHNGIDFWTGALKKAQEVCASATFRVMVAQEKEMEARAAATK